MFDGTNTNTNSSKIGDDYSVETCESSHSQSCVKIKVLFLQCFIIFDPAKLHDIPLIFADSDINNVCFKSHVVTNGFNQDLLFTFQKMFSIGRPTSNFQAFVYRWACFCWFCWYIIINVSLVALAYCFTTGLYET